MPSKRTITLIFACVTALSAGTQYVYSAYAPQMASRLELTSTQTNFIGAAGNLGVYLSGPFVGASVDKRGPRPTLIFSAIILFTGYTIIRLIYAGGLPSDTTTSNSTFSNLPDNAIFSLNSSPNSSFSSSATPDVHVTIKNSSLSSLSSSTTTASTTLFSIVGIPGLVLAELMTGIGSAAAVSSAGNGVAKSFGAKQRASALSLVLSCLGLSAAFYSAIAHGTLFTSSRDPTAAFLWLLATGCAFSMMLGAFFVRPQLHPDLLITGAVSGSGQVNIQPNGSSNVLRGDHFAPTTTTVGPNRSGLRPGGLRRLSTGNWSEGSAIVDDDDDEDEDDISESEAGEESRTAAATGIVATERTPLIHEDISTSMEGIGHPSSTSHSHSHIKDKNVQGWALLKEVDFYIMFTYLALCSGTGLMYINNLGTLTRTLASPSWDPRQVALKQASLVSLLSVFNCTGRLVTGFLSDYFMHRAPIQFRFSRIWWQTSTSLLLFVTQLVVSRTDQVYGIRGLWLPTVLTGFSYGMMWGVSGVICLERFGIKSFSRNNGIMALAPAISGQLYNVCFGLIYDSHVPATPSHSNQGNPRLILAERNCTLGRDCYVQAFHYTSIACACAVCLALLMASRKSMRRGGGAL